MRKIGTRQMTLRTSLAMVALLLAAGCKKEAPAPAPQPEAPTPPTAPAPAAAPTPTDAPAPATPTALPAAASPTNAQPAAGKPRVSIDLRVGAKMEPGLPKVGEPAAFRLTFLDHAGQTLHDVEPLLGTKVLLVATRADLGWATVLHADELADKEHGKHEFTFAFPFSGIHRLWVVYRLGGHTYTEEIVLTVEGKPWVGQELPDVATTWNNDAGLAATLHMDPKEPQVCQPLLLATSWTRGGKQVRMAAEPDAPTTWYIAIDSALGEVVVSEPEDKPTDPPTDPTQTLAARVGGDLGTAATLKLSRFGKYRILALATPPAGRAIKAGKKASAPSAEPLVVPFVLSVSGQPQLDGCP